MIFVISKTKTKNSQKKRKFDVARISCSKVPKGNRVPKTSFSTGQQTEVARAL